MKRFFFLSFLLSLSMSCFSQTKALRWNKDSLLTWSDFQAPVDKSVPFSAYAATAIRYYMDTEQPHSQNNPGFTTASFFSRSKSWVLVSNQTIEMLKHEQIHFDIAEYFSRQLLVALTGKKFTSDNPVPEITTIYRQMVAYKEKLEDLYDLQTDHSKNINEQKKWELLVQNILENNTPLVDLLQRFSVQ